MPGASLKAFDPANVVPCAEACLAAPSAKNEWLLFYEFGLDEDDDVEPDLQTRLYLIIAAFPGCETDDACRP
jgi:hypothetical protein